MPLYPRALKTAAPRSSPFLDHGYGTTYRPVFPYHRTRIVFPTHLQNSCFSCRVSGITALNQMSSYAITDNNHNGVFSNVSSNWKFPSVGVKDIDVSTLGNLCVDVVLNVPQLPPSSPDQRKAYMERLAASPPDKRCWEAGGNCNVAIAAARLGLNCVTIGHVGGDTYGKFLMDMLHDEGIGVVGMSSETEIIDGSSASYETLLCWVLVDPMQRHGFCSRADFREEPHFYWMKTLSREVKIAIQRSRILFFNGYDFDEFSPDMLKSALGYTVEVGTAVFFDPGPRGKSLLTGTPEEQIALQQFLTKSDVLLLTSDEAESLTGIGNPISAGQELLRKGLRTKWVIVKMGDRGSIIITMSSIVSAPAFKVDVIDTVGCGDSFVAAIAFGFIHNLPLVNTLTIANAVGAATAMGCGAGRNVATLKNVKELIRASNLNEDGEYWRQLFDNNLFAQEITFLSKVVINGGSRVHCIALQEIVSELLPKLEAPKYV